MTTINFEGNTYTFGATVSANPGTGTTSYVFGGLSSGETYGFILRAFNGFGFSDFVGPAITKTLENILEVREEISSFSWSYQYINVYDLAYFSSGSTFNQFASSADLSASAWFLWPTTPGYSKVTGFTAPDGSTTAWKFTTGGDNSLKLLMQGALLEQGSTYIISYYVDLSGSCLQNALNRPRHTSTIYWEQIDPISGATVATAFNNVTIPVGATGWNRFNFRHYQSQNTELVGLALFGFGGGLFNITLWGPQLEKE